MRVHGHTPHVEAPECPLSHESSVLFESQPLLLLTTMSKQSFIFVHRTEQQTRKGRRKAMGLFANEV